jgi:hypothetical protein
LQKWPKYLGYFFPKLKLCINFAKNGLGYLFWRFFYKLIWSPCLWPTTKANNCWSTWENSFLQAHVFSIFLKAFWFLPHKSGPEMMTRREFIKPEQCCQMLGIF